MEIAVIGGGIVGAALTYWLARAGAKVTLYEAAEPGQGTSGASFAWLNASNKPPRAYHDLNAAGMAEHAGLARECAGDNWAHFTGGLHWSATPAGRERLGDLAAHLNAWDYPVEVMTPAQAMELEPGLALDPEEIEQVWYTPGEGWADAPLLIRTVLARAGELGAVVRTHAAVTAIEAAGGRVTGLRLATDEVVGVDAAVNCAGPRTAEVAALAGVTLPVGRAPGLLAVTAPVEPCGRVVCHADNIYFRPEPAGGLVLGHADDLDATVTAETPRTPPPPACAELLNRATRYRPAVTVAGLAAARIGVRPMPADGLTIAGLLPSYANFYVAVTHSGVTLGPLLGRLVAETIISGAAPAQLAPFTPNRFA
ncbi:MAG TPA: FAD-dependent oxidoreductase [Thermomicrobiales bacterium]|nr:FAD-dependent oxidoreductase [Thermomicrobiales bacterium]